MPIEEWVQRAFAEFARLLGAAGHDVWQHTFGLFDPFWWLAVEGVLIIVACVAAAWFFNILRPVAGAVVAATILFLVGYWKGETAEQKRDRLKQKKRQQI